LESLYEIQKHSLSKKGIYTGENIGRNFSLSFQPEYKDNVPPGVYKLEISDAPHPHGITYKDDSKYSTQWFRIDYRKEFGKGFYFHFQGYSLLIPDPYILTPKYLCLIRRKRTPVLPGNILYSINNPSENLKSK
jgi:hypothetical protein